MVSSKHRARSGNEELTVIGLDTNVRKRKANCQGAEGKRAKNGRGST